MEKFLTFEEFTISPHEIIFKHKDKDYKDPEKTIVREVHLSFSYKSRIGFDSSEVRNYREDAWKVYQQEHIKDFYK